MQALLIMSSGIDAISKKFGQLADYLVLFCALISAGNATIRYLFSMSSNGWLEIQWYMFAGIVLLGASYTLCMNEHVRVDLLYGWVSDRTRLLIDVFGIVIFLLPTTGFFIWACWPFFHQSYASCFTEVQFPAFNWLSISDWLSGGRWFLDTILFPGGQCETSPNASGLIRWPVKMLLVLGFSMLFLQGISELIKRIAGLLGIVKIDTTYEKPLQ